VCAFVFHEGFRVQGSGFRVQGSGLGVCVFETHENTLTLSIHSTSVQHPPSTHLSLPAHSVLN
jgi:hypothetical protein